MHHYSHTSHPCARFFLPHIQAAVPLTKVICGCFLYETLWRTFCFYSALYFVVFYNLFPPLFALETHAEKYSPVSAVVCVFIIFTLRRFHIMKNYQPLDSCPDVRSFQLRRGNQARRRENRGVRTASTRVLKRMAKCSLLKNLFFLLSAEWMLSNHFQPSRWSEECHQFRRFNPSLYLKNLSNLSANGASEWKSEMERDRRERRRQNAKTASLLTTFIHSITKHVLRQKSTAAGKIMSMQTSISAQVFMPITLSLLRLSSLLPSDINPASLESDQHLQL